MLLKVFGVLDLISAFLFGISLFGDFMPHVLLFAPGIYLLIKGIMFAILADFSSFIDIICGLVIISSVWLNIHIFVSVIVIIFLAQKGVISLIS